MADRDKGSEHGGLDAWFKGHGQGKSKAKGKAPYGDWIAITPVKNTITKDDGEKKTYEAGDIVGPCGISKDLDWKDITNNGKDPLKCMPRQKAHGLSKSERAELAKNKRKKEKSNPNTGKPVNTPTFGEKAKDIKKKSQLEKKIAELEEKINLKKNLDLFMDEFWSKTSSHPFERASRIWKNEMISEVRPFDGKIHISWIQALEPRQGSGNSFMEWICKLADKYQVSMGLNPEPKGQNSMPKKRLKEFYSKFNFKKDKYGYMVRKPNS